MIVSIFERNNFVWFDKKCEVIANKFSLLQISTLKWIWKFWVHIFQHNNSVISWICMYILIQRE